MRTQLNNDCTNHQAPKKLSILLDARVWSMSLIYFCGITGLYAISFYLPTLIEDSGVKNIFTIGLISSIPYMFAVIVMIVVSSSSDYFKERRFHLVGVSVMAAIGFVGVGLFGGNVYLALLFISLATGGILTLIPLFWSLPAAILSGMAAAIAIAIINSIGNLSGFVTPYLVGYIIDSTASISLALYIVAMIILLGAILISRFIRKANNI